MSFDTNGIISASLAPVSSDTFQRAVFKAAPKRFSIEFLPPTKLGSSYYHGMRICSISRGDRSSLLSMGSTESTSQYDIWRRWEDCLWLQDHLETEYKQAARERRTRLAQGKGVKTFNGMYKQDMASSWESLPPGPEPTSVANDIHAHLPSLTKKTTFFRPNPATIEKHQNEFVAMVEALMSDDMPALVKEIRATRDVTDFFGFWRRDVEFEEKYRKKNPHLAHAPRSAMTDSVFSTYFPNSSSSTQLYSQSRRSKRSLSSSTSRPDSLAETVTSLTSTLRGFAPSTKSRQSKQATSKERERTDRDIRRHSSSSESSAQSEEAVSDSSCTANSSAPHIAEDTPPVKYNHNPHRGPEPPSPIREFAETETLAEKSPLDTMGGLAFHIHRQSKAGDRRSNRNCSIISPATFTPPSLESTIKEHGTPDVPRSPGLGSHQSWQTFASVDSANTYLDGIDFKLPREGRESMQSVATARTIDSTDGCIPDRNLHMPRASVPVSLSDFEMFSESDGQMSLLNSNARPLSLLPEEPDCSSRPETPVAGFSDRKQPHDLPSLTIPGSRASFFSHTPSPNPPFASLAPPSPEPGAARSAPSTSLPSSPTDSRFSFAVSVMTEESSSTATPQSEVFSPTPMTPTTAESSLCSPMSTAQKGYSASGMLSLKVSLNSAIIMVKVPRDIEFPELRQKIYAKFVGQEGIPLSQDFVLMMKADSATIVDDYEWRAVESSLEGNKLVLQVINEAS